MAPGGKHDLDQLTARTLAHYDANAATFWEGTRDHDVTSSRDALLEAIAATGAAPPYRILDLGCGPGRDLAAFRALGHLPVGVDGSARFAEMARAQGLSVLQQDFLHLSLPRAEFHGVFANASLFHVPTRELPRVLAELREALRPSGVLFASNPHGDGEEGFRGERYGAFHSHARWKAMVAAQGFLELRHWYRPEGKPREQQPWLATLSARIERAP